MVVFFHSKLDNSYLYQTVFSGKLGVDIFFVLSGFLITTLLLKEKISSSKISLKNFYIRRAFRILPLAYLYIILSIVLNFIWHTHISPVIFIASFLFLLDFSQTRKYGNPYTGHYWSLSVEEQFYILFPVLLKKSWRLYLITILFVLFVVPLIITAEFLYFPNQTNPLYLIIHLLIKFQGIALGCFFSMLTFKSNWIEKNILPWRHCVNPLLIAAAMLLGYEDFLTIKSMYTNLLISTLVGCFIVINLYPGNDILYRLLSNHIVRKIGMLSYSIYIWQQMFTLRDDTLPSWLWKPPFNFLWMIGISCLSYFYFEKYFLKLKAKFSIVKPKPLD